jgi:hypothetical protein
LRIEEIALKNKSPEFVGMAALRNRSWLVLIDKTDCPVTYQPGGNFSSAVL